MPPNLETRPNLMTLQTEKRLRCQLAQVQRKIQERNLALGASIESAQDWHDNAAYDDIRQDLAVLGAQELRLLRVLDNLVLIQPREKIDTVKIGNTVVVKYEEEWEKETFTVLGPEDSLTNPNWISFVSPLGMALIGQSAGSTIVLENGIRVELTDILPGDF